MQHAVHQAEALGVGYQLDTVKGFFKDKILISLVKVKKVIGVLFDVIEGIY